MGRVCDVPPPKITVWLLMLKFMLTIWWFYCWCDWGLVEARLCLVFLMFPALA